MAKSGDVALYIGTYPNEAGAQADYDVVKALHEAGAVGTYDAAVVTKDEAGKVHENKDEMATRHGAWGGAAVGGLIGGICAWYAGKPGWLRSSRKRRRRCTMR